MFDLIYPFLVVIHTFCAIFLIGFIFVDIVFLSLVEKIKGDDFDREMWGAMKKRVRIVTMSSLLMLVFTGIVILGRWINTTIENFGNLEILLLIKVVLSIFLIVIICAILMNERKFTKILCPFAFGVSVLIVICAKIAFYL